MVEPKKEDERDHDRIGVFEEKVEGEGKEVIPARSESWLGSSLEENGGKNTSNLLRSAVDALYKFKLEDNDDDNDDGGGGAYTYVWSEEELAGSWREGGGDKGKGNGNGGGMEV